jgi:hypothetical protein
MAIRLDCSAAVDSGSKCVKGDSLLPAQLDNESPEVGLLSLLDQSKTIGSPIDKEHP